jgi:transcription factor MYB, plant
MQSRCAWQANKVIANGNLTFMLGEGTEVLDKNSKIHIVLLELYYVFHYFLLPSHIEHVVMQDFLVARTDNSIKNHWNSSLKKRLDNYKTSSTLPVSMHVTQNTHNGLKHAKQPTALNHIDLNKDPLEIVGHSEHSSHLHACNVKDTKSCSKFLSLSMPIAQPEIPCEALIAEDFAVASAMQELKLDAVSDKVTGKKFVCEEGVKIHSLNVGASTVDHVIDKTVCSGSSRPEGRTRNLCELSWMND